MQASSGKGWRRGWIANAALSTALLVAVATAHAAPAPSRPEYVGQLEEICRPDALATQRAMTGVRRDINAGRLGTAAGKFGKASTIFGSTVKKISAVPRPSADLERLARWFGYLKSQNAYLGQITVQLRSGHNIKAQRLTARFIHDGNLANNVVLAFGFNYCSFKFARYG